MGERSKAVNPMILLAEMPSNVEKPRFKNRRIGLTTLGFLAFKPLS